MYLAVIQRGFDKKHHVSIVPDSILFIIRNMNRIAASIIPVLLTCSKSLISVL